MSRRRTGAVAVGVGALTAVVLSLAGAKTPLIIGSAAALGVAGGVVAGRYSNRDYAHKKIDEPTTPAREPVKKPPKDTANEPDRYEMWKTNNSQKNLIRQKEKGAIYGDDLLKLLELKCGRDPYKLCLEAGYLSFQGLPAINTFCDAVREATGDDNIPPWFFMDLEDDFGGELKWVLEEYEIEYDSAKRIVSRLVKSHCPKISEEILYERTTQLLADYGYDNSVAYLHSAESKFTDKDFHGSILACTNSIDANKNNESVKAIAYNVRAIAKYSTKDYQGAVHDHSKAIGIELDDESEHDTAYYNRGIAKKELGDLEGALEDWRVAAELGDECAVNLLRMYDQLIASTSSKRNEKGASEYLKPELELATIHFEVSYNILEKEFLKGVNKRISTSEGFNQEQKKVSKQFSEGCKKLEVEDYQGAITLFSKLIVDYPEFYPAYVNRGISEINTNQYEDAINDLSKAIELDGSLSIAYLHRGFAKQQISDFRGAYEDWKMSDKVSENGNSEAVRVLNEFAETIESLGESNGNDSLQLIAKEIRQYINKEVSEDEKVYESHESTIFTSGDSVVEHRTRLNNFLLEFWKFTPFAETHSVPTMLSSVNEDGSINFSYCRGTPEFPDRSTESYYYTIHHDGKILVKETNEVLNMNDMSHLFLIVPTIIRDVYGEYDTKEVTEKFINSITNSK